MVIPGMNGRKINRRQKALLRELRSATSLTLRCQPVDRTRKTGDLLSEVQRRFTESFATRDFMEASAKIESLHCVRRGLLAKSCSSCLVRSPCFNRSRKSRNVLVLKYKPTPTIIEAAQALYQGHKVAEITRSDAEAINLSQTAECIAQIIEDAKSKRYKAICFVTGVPGAGKTLAGLNLVTQRTNAHEDEHAVFLSGNGPLVDVLREALARDEHERSKLTDTTIRKADAARKVKSFIQNIMHFRDDNLANLKAPIERVAVFDEAQRAWDRDHLANFISRKKG